MVRKFIQIAIILLVLSNTSFAQELICNLTVSTDQIRTSETQIFQQLEQDLSDFINNKRWTEDVYKQEERIECDIIVNIKSMRGQSSFVADMMIQSSRPIYGTDYSSPVFNYVDQDVGFTYQQGQPIYFVESNFTNNLTSVMAFYVYLILGFDYDTFEENGGSKYFDKANEVMLMSQQSGDDGWTTDGKNVRDRYNLITQIMNPQYSKMHEGYYKYHRLAMDKFEEDQMAARKIVTNVIKSTEAMNRIAPNSVLLSVFYNAKVNEIANMYTKASAAEKTQILNILENVDPTNMDKYDKIKNGG